MENKFITRKELEQEIRTHLKSCDLKDLKWLYCYFSDFEEFPLVVNEAAPGYKVWAGDEKPDIPWYDGDL